MAGAGPIVDKCARMLLTHSGSWCRGTFDLVASNRTYTSCLPSMAATQDFVLTPVRRLAPPSARRAGHRLIASGRAERPLIREPARCARSARRHQNRRPVGSSCSCQRCLRRTRRLARPKPSGSRWCPSDRRRRRRPPGALAGRPRRRPQTCLTGAAARAP